MSDLYPINKELKRLVDLYVSTTVEMQMNPEISVVDIFEIQNDILGLIRKLDIAKNDLIVNMGMLIKEFELEIKNRKSLIEYQKDQISQIDDRINIAKNEIVNNLPLDQVLGNDYVQLSFRKSSAVKIDCPIDTIPVEFMRIKPAPAPEPDKKELKKALDNGVLVPGVSIEERHNLQIK